MLDTFNCPLSKVLMPYTSKNAHEKIAMYPIHLFFYAVKIVSFLAGADGGPSHPLRLRSVLQS